MIVNYLLLFYLRPYFTKPITLDHLTFRALYFSQIAFELSVRALYIWRERTTRKIEDNSGQNS